ncbi:tape measure protein [Marinobacter fonticola]|uniref:tape measure protein n=1 Tax=Marinobacter fonticola TaxID=2603215 RepID=UPI0011E7ABC3|nr:tape measure protein [Marinobacter fonticola]
MSYRARLEVTIDSKSGETRLRRLQYELDRTEKAGALVGKTLLAAGGALAGAVTLNAVGRLATMADEFALLQSRVRAATDATGDYVAVSERLFDISQDTGTTLKSNIELFDRIRIGAQELGRSNDEVLELVEAVNQLGQIGGSSASELSNAAIQLSQSLSGGIVRAEEFNSIIENTPRLAQAIAEGLGKSTGELREMVLAGNLLADDVFESILGQTDKIERDFGKLESTIERAGTTFGNSFDVFIGRLNEATNASSNVARIIEGLASGLDNATVKLFGAADPIENLSDKIQDLVEERFKLVFLLRQEQEAGSVAALATQSRIDAIDREVKSLDDRRKALVQQRIAQDDATRAAEAASGFKPKPAAIEDVRDAEDLRASLDKRFGIELQYRRRIEEINDLYNKRALDADTKAELERQAELARIRAQNPGTGNAYDSILGQVDAQGRGQEYIAAQQAEFEAVRRSLDQRYAIEQEHAARMQALRDGERQGLIEDQTEMNRLVTASVEQRNKELMQLEQARQFIQLGAAEQLFGNMADLAKEFAGEQSDLYRTMFAFQKAAGIAQSLVAINTGIAMAAANPWPINLGAMASVAGATAGLVSNISAITLQGQAHDGIDRVPKSGTWNLEAGERVTTSKTSDKLDKTLDDVQKGMNTAPVINVIENPDRAGNISSRNDTDGRQVIDIVVADFRGGGPISKTFESTYGQKRKGR